MQEDVRLREPASQVELEQQLEAARASDAAAAVSAGPAATAIPPPNDAYRRTLKRIGTSLLLGVSLGIGTFWRPSVGAALADTVDGAAEELADQIANLLGGRFSTNLGFFGIIAAWSEPALRKQVAKLNAPKPTLVLHPQPVTEQESAT
jgi:hypothetical protein